MSSYIKSAKNPKTNKIIKAFFLDDYFGSHKYAVAFKKDGKDADWERVNSIKKDCDIYSIDKIELYA